MIKNHGKAPFLLCLIVQKALIVAHQHLGLHLFHGLQNNADNNDQAGSAKGNVCAKQTAENIRQYGDNNQSHGSDKDQVIQHPGQVIAGGLARSDTRNKAALPLHIIRHHQRVEGDGCIEVCKENYQQDK